MHEDRSPWTPRRIPESFWVIIEKAGRDRQRLRALLEPMSHEGLIAFYVHFRDAAVALTAPRYLEHMERPVSEDSADDMSRWVVTQGEQYYLDVYDHPEKMPPNEDSIPGAEMVLYNQIFKVFHERFHEDFPMDAVL